MAVVAGAAGLAASTAAAAPSARTAQPAPPPVDHQLCYNAKGSFTIPPGIRLINQFSPNGFVPTISSTLTIHCNPVEKILPSGTVFAITNPNAHLGCYPITVTSTQPTPTVIAPNWLAAVAVTMES